MNHAATVGHIERRGDPIREVEGSPHAEGPAPQPRRQRLALDVLHGDEVAALLVDADLVDGADVRMIERRGGLGLVPQLLARFEVVAAGADQELDRHRPLQLGVMRQEHLAHAAGSEAVAELIVRNPSKGLGHGRKAPSGRCEPDSALEYTARLQLPTAAADNRRRADESTTRAVSARPSATPAARGRCARCRHRSGDAPLNGLRQTASRELHQTTVRLFRSRSWQRNGLPGRRAFFPAVVCQRPLIRSVQLHDHQLPVRLWDIRHWRFLPETEARSAEQHMLSIGRTGRVCVVVDAGAGRDINHNNP